MHLRLESKVRNIIVSLIISSITFGLICLIDIYVYDTIYDQWKAAHLPTAAAAITFALIFAAVLVAYWRGAVSGETKAAWAYKETGVVKWFNVKKGFGFITSASGEDIFVHYKQIMGKDLIDGGQQVKFIVFEGEKGLQAKEVEIL